MGSRYGPRAKASQPIFDWPAAWQHELKLLRSANSKTDARDASRRLLRMLGTVGDQGCIVEGKILAMLAGQCARCQLHELLRAICKYVCRHMASFSGRDFAEVLSAASKLNCLEADILHSAMTRCAKEPAHFWKCLRDVATVAKILLFSLTLLQNSMEYAHALQGLVDGALQHLLTKRVQFRDVTEFAYAIAHAVGTHQVELKSHRVEAALCTAFSHMREGMHEAPAREVAMAASAAAAGFALLTLSRDDVLLPCLMTAIKVTANRSIEFSLHDLSCVAAACAQSRVADNCFENVLSGHVSQMSSPHDAHDIICMLWAAVQVPGWNTASFASWIIRDLPSCEFTRLTARELCAMSLCLAHLGQMGTLPLTLIAGEAVTRERKESQRWTSKLTALQVHVCRELVGSLVESKCQSLTNPSCLATLHVLLHLWPSTSAERDSSVEELIFLLCRRQPWLGATASELASVIGSLSRAAVCPAADIWSALLGEVEKLLSFECEMCDATKLLDSLAEVKDKPQNSSDSMDKLVTCIAAHLQAGARLNEPTSGKFKRVLKTNCKHIPVTAKEFLIRAGWLEHGQCLEHVSDKLAKSRNYSNTCNTSGEMVEQCPETCTTDQPQRSSICIALPPPGLGITKVIVEHESTHFQEVPNFQHAAQGDLQKSISISCTDNGSLHTQTCPQNSNAVDMRHIYDHADMQVHGHAYSCFGHEHGSSSMHGGDCDDDLHRGDCSHCDVNDCAHGHDHAHGHGHCLNAHCPGQGHSSDDSCSASMSNVAPMRAHEHQVCSDAQCCPQVASAGLRAPALRLNSHCSFQGHCVQVKNTFLHVPCNASDSEDDAGCIVCRMKRSTSLDGYELSGGSPKT